jgi:hypothetical protein
MTILSDHKFRNRASVKSASQRSEVGRAQTRVPAASAQDTGNVATSTRSGLLVLDTGAAYTRSCFTTCLTCSDDEAKAMSRIRRTRCRGSSASFAPAACSRVKTSWTTHRSSRRAAAAAAAAAAECSAPTLSRERTGTLSRLNVATESRAEVGRRHPGDRTDDDHTPVRGEPIDERRHLRPSRDFDDHVEGRDVPTRMAWPAP